jgi:hypothetical protein
LDNGFDIVVKDLNGYGTGDVINTSIALLTPYEKKVSINSL